MDKRQNEKSANNNSLRTQYSKRRVNEYREHEYNLHEYPAQKTRQCESFHCPMTLTDVDGGWENPISLSNRPSITPLSTPASPRPDSRRSFNAFPRPWQPPDRSDCKKPIFVKNKSPFNLPLLYNKSLCKQDRIQSDINGSETVVNEAVVSCARSPNNVANDYVNQQPSITGAHINETPNTRENPSCQLQCSFSRSNICSPVRTGNNDKTLIPTETRTEHNATVGGTKPLAETPAINFSVSGSLPLDDSQEAASSLKIGEVKCCPLGGARSLVSEDQCKEVVEPKGSPLSQKTTSVSVIEGKNIHRGEPKLLLGGNGHDDREAPLSEPTFVNSLNLISRKYVRKKPDIPGNLSKRRSSEEKTTGEHLSVQVKTRSLPASPGIKVRSNPFHLSNLKKKESRSPEESRKVTAGRTTVNQILATLNFARFRLEELTGNLGGSRKESHKKQPTQVNTRSVFPSRPPKSTGNDLEKLRKSTERLKLPPEPKHLSSYPTQTEMEISKPAIAKQKSSGKGILKKKTNITRTHSSPSSTSVPQAYSSHNYVRRDSLYKSPELSDGVIQVQSRDIPFRTASISQEGLKSDTRGGNKCVLRLYSDRTGYGKSHTLPRSGAESTISISSADSFLPASYALSTSNCELGPVCGDSDPSYTFQSEVNNIDYQKQNDYRNNVVSCSSNEKSNRPIVAYGDDISTDIEVLESREIVKDLIKKMERQTASSDRAGIIDKYRTSCPKDYTHTGYAVKPPLRRDKTIEEETQEELLKALPQIDQSSQSNASIQRKDPNPICRVLETEAKSSQCLVIRSSSFNKKDSHSTIENTDVGATSECRLVHTRPCLSVGDSETESVDRAHVRKHYEKETSEDTNSGDDNSFAITENAPQLNNYKAHITFTSLRKCISDPSLKSLIATDPKPISEQLRGSCNLQQSPTFPPLGTVKSDSPKSRTWHADMMHNLITAAQRKKDFTLYNLQSETSFNKQGTATNFSLENPFINKNDGFPYRRSSYHLSSQDYRSESQDSSTQEGVEEEITQGTKSKLSERMKHEIVRRSSLGDRSEDSEAPVTLLVSSMPVSKDDNSSSSPQVVLSDLTPQSIHQDSYNETETSSGKDAISRNGSPGPYTGDSDSGDTRRSPRIPRRYSKRPLRGPYGEMLEAEMNKSKRSSGQYLGEDMYLRPPDSANTSPRPSSPVSPTLLSPTDLTPGTSLCRFPIEDIPMGAILPTSRSLDDSSLPMYYASVTTESDGFLKPGITVQSSESDHEGSSCLKTLHQRTSSSPSKLFFEAGCTSDDEQDMIDYIYQARRSKLIKKESVKEPPKESVDSIDVSDLGASVPSETPNRELPPISKMDRSYYKRKDTRIHIISELHQTEKSYVENLNFLLTKYQLPLRRTENSHIIDQTLLSDIFFKIPEIHSYHNRMLEELQTRLESRDPNMSVGDVIMQLVQDPEVTEAYTSYVSNWKTAQEATKAGLAKPAFRHFLSVRTTDHHRKRDLKSLLISIVQRFPHYELILKRLLDHTPLDHPDHEIIKEAIGEVQRVCTAINAVDQEALRLEQQQFILKEISQCIDGTPDSLVHPDRTYIMHDQVLLYSGSQGSKERCLFLFSDILAVTSIKRKASAGRKSNSMQLSFFTGLESYKLRVLHNVPLDDVEIGRSRDDNIKKLLRERETHEEDLQTLQKVSQLIKTLHYSKSVLEEALLDVSSNIKKQLDDRHTTETHLCQLELNLMTEDGLQCHLYTFSSAEKRTKWEDALNQAKQKLDRFPLPEFITALPIRKTRAGLQFTCASPTLPLSPHDSRDVWVCNSDGYVGQVCVMSLEPEAEVACCNGVCNARILSIASIPGYQHRRKNERVPSVDCEDDDGPQPEEVEEFSLQPTMWLGTEDGSIHVYNCNDTIRSRKHKYKFQPGSPVHCIIYIDGKVFASLANGQLIVYHRDHGGCWERGGQEVITLSTAAAPITRMVESTGKLWCSACNDIKILNIQTLELENSFSVGNDTGKGITCMVSTGNYIWIAMNNSAVVKMYHAITYDCIHEVAVTPAVKKILSTCDEIIKQHKSACLRITSLLVCNDILWVGTSAGIIITLPLRDLTSGTRKPQRTLNMVGLSYGHTGHVRFLTAVEIPQNEDSQKLSNNKKNSTEKKAENPRKYLVISGGDGYEDFRNSGNTEVAGRDDSTNHLLLWNA